MGDLSWTLKGKKAICHFNCCENSRQESRTVHLAEYAVNDISDLALQQEQNKYHSLFITSP